MWDKKINKQNRGRKGNREVGSIEYLGVNFDIINIISVLFSSTCLLHSVSQQVFIACLLWAEHVSMNQEFSKE